MSESGRRSRAVRTAALLAAVALGASGCRLGVTTAADIAVDGSARVEVALRLDGALRVELDRLDVDPTLDLDVALADDGTWRRERSDDADGGLVLRFVRDVEDPDALEAALRELAAGLTEDDPALLVDLDVAVARGGAVEITGTAGVRAPSTAGALADGIPVGPSGEDLAALAARMVDARLVLTLPGPVERSDADRVDGRTLTWELPVGGVRPVRASGGPAPLLERVPWTAVGATALVALVVLVARRRGRGPAAREVSPGA